MTIKGIVRQFAFGAEPAVAASQAAAPGRRGKTGVKVVKIFLFLNLY